MTYSVRNEQSVVESRHATVTEALRAALASGQDVYLHADDCQEDERELGPKCPCRPVKFRPSVIVE